VIVDRFGFHVDHPMEEAMRASHDAVLPADQPAFFSERFQKRETPIGFSKNKYLGYS
jgi:hypothetical protein